MVKKEGKQKKKERNLLYKFKKHFFLFGMTPKKESNFCRKKKIGMGKHGEIQKLGEKLKGKTGSFRRALHPQFLPHNVAGGAARLAVVEVGVKAST